MLVAALTVPEAAPTPLLPPEVALAAALTDPLLEVPTPIDPAATEPAPPAAAGPEGEVAAAPAPAPAPTAVEADV